MTREDFKTIKELPMEFYKGGQLGFNFKQVYNSKGWYIYELSKDSHKHYEVFKEVIAKSFWFDKEENKFIIDEENGYVQYPSNEAFGKTAMCVNSIERAFEIINGKDSNLEEEQTPNEMEEENFENNKNEIQDKE